jgi:hypothetical protein
MNNESQTAQDKRIYNLAKDYLLDIATKQKKPITADIIEQYLVAKPRPTTLPGIFERILGSAQNANMRAGVIGGSIDGIDNLREVLCGFEPASIVQKYGSKWEPLLDQINERVHPRVRKGKELNKKAIGLWPKYCKTILASAEFMSEFSSADDFYQWVDFFYKDKRSRLALPLLLQNKIYGIGLALACDFLKELGYTGFGKPDVHLRNIFENIGMCPRDATDYQLFEAIIRVSQNAAVTPYGVDKVFWLIGSGKYYLHDIKVGRHGDDFIEYVKKLEVM